MDNPLVSILICSYNRADMLSETLDSVLAQTYRPVEILLFDDGSTDHTPKIAQRYAGQIRYFRQENQGIAVTRTNACQLAEGTYIAFQDDDDIMPPDRIETLYQALQVFPQAIFAVGDWAVIDQDGKPTGDRFLPKGNNNDKQPVLIENGYEAVLWPKVPAAPHTTLFRKSAGKQIGWFDARYRYASEDKDFFARLARLGPIVYTPTVVSYYRRGHVSMTNSRMAAEWQTVLFFENHLKMLNPHGDPLHKRLRFRILSQLKKIARLENMGLTLPEQAYFNRQSSSIALLGHWERMQYWVYRYMKLPLKKQINRFCG